MGTPVNTAANRAAVSYRDKNHIQTNNRKGVRNERFPGYPDSENPFPVPDLNSLLFFVGNFYI